MTEFDYIVLLVVFLSVLLGWWRGLVYEILSLISWGISFFVAKAWAVEFRPYMPEVLEGEAFRSAAAFATVFITVLILCGVAAWALNKLIKSFGLDWRTDGVAGAIFGFVRGGLLVVVLVLLAGLTALPQTSYWQNAVLSKPLQNTAYMVRDILPPDTARRVSF